MAELSVLLAEQADAIRALPADLLMEPDLVVLDVDRDGRRLQLEVFFETEVWKLYFVSWIVTTASGADEGHGKAATAEETLALMADMIGRHFAGARPTIARA
ncbi:hypothetical protein [Roseateles aquatilis]|uniref:hypothetical protein n=1 Tax=Roseateles aquatilis TaxID=431061 RepID=UPI0011328A83|nr:hypothetical protein [Roseateles aquatilis]